METHQVLDKSVGDNAKDAEMDLADEMERNMKINHPQWSMVRAHK